MSRLNVNSVNAHSGVYVNVTGSTDGGLIISASPSNDGTPVLQVHGSISASGELTCSNALFTGDIRCIGEAVISASAPGGIWLGDANTDNVIFGADVSSSIIPDVDDAYDLGTNTQQWKDIYIDGVGYIDAVNQSDVTVTNQLKGDWNWTDDGANVSLFVNSADGNVGVKVSDPNQELEVAGRISSSLQLSVGGAGTTDGHITGSGNLVISGTSEFLGGMALSNITASGTIWVSGSGNNIFLHNNGNITSSGIIETRKFILTDPDVAHGITNHIQTDAYGDLGPIHGTRGGLLVNGTSDQESADARSLTLRGLCNDTHTDTVPVVELNSAKRSGTAIQALAAAETVLQVQNYTTELVTVLGDGKLGIGTTTPTEALQVAGNISASGFINTDSHITASGNISATGTILPGAGGMMRTTPVVLADADTTLTIGANGGRTNVIPDVSSDRVYTLPTPTAAGQYFHFVYGGAAADAEAISIRTLTTDDSVYVKGSITHLDTNADNAAIICSGTPEMLQVDLTQALDLHFLALSTTIWYIWGSACSATAPVWST